MRSKIILILVAPILLAQTQGLPVICTPTCMPSPTNIYVDSANGSDSNTGTCPPGMVNASVGGTPSWSTCAYKTLAKINSTLATGRHIGLTYGSSFREAGIQAPSAANHNLTIAAAGQASLGKPIIDLSGAISSGSWTADGMGAYSTAITIPADTTGSSGLMNVWETISGTTQTLTTASSQANCDSTAGSYYTSLAAAGAGTLYVHPIGSTNPAVDGNIYEYAKNWWGIDVASYGASGIRFPSIYNIVTQKQFGNDGSIRAARGATLSGISTLWGGKHNLLVQDGSTILSATIGACNATLGGIPVIQFDDAVLGLPSSLANVTVDATGSSGTCTAYYSHKTGAGSFGSTTLTGWIVKNSIAFGFGAEHPITLINADCTQGGVSTCFQASSGTNTVTDLLSTASSRDLSIASGATVNCTRCALNGSGFSYVSVSTLNISASSLGSGVYLYGAGGAVIHTDYGGGGNTFKGIYSIFDSDGATTITADNNTFCVNGAGANTHPGAINAVSKTKAQWQGLGFDLNSTFGVTCP